jgi:Uma2 family endonuclease
MDIKLDHRTRLCPDVLVVPKTATSDLNRTFFDPDEVQLVIEVVSPESEQRDRASKPPRYAKAEIGHFWRVEENDGKPVVYVYELDPATKAYGLTGIHHGKLSVPRPFEIGIDLDELPR